MKHEMKGKIWTFT